MIKKLQTIGMLLLLQSSIIQLNAQNRDTSNLYDMDLSALMNIEVTTASKKAQSIDQAPAAVFVISKEDIKGYGYHNIGEALRMVPGVEIMQSGDQNYEVAIRGFDITSYNTSNKVLWLIDGRSVYNDGYGGVRLSSFPISMDDIERIEVIRGPGSCLYGANAFSGIINVITKKAIDQHGIFAKVTYGNFGQTNSNIRYGAGSGKLSYKLTAGFDNIDKSKTRYSGLSSDSITTLTGLGWKNTSINAMRNLYGNFVLNYDLSETSNINLSSGISSNQADEYYNNPAPMYANDYFVKLNYNDKKNTFRIYYNGQQANGYNTGLYVKQANSTSTFTDLDKLMIATQMIDAEYQRSIKFGEKVSAIAGLSYRENFVSGNIFSIDGKNKTNSEGLAAGFGQIEYNPIDKLSVVLGGRYDYNTVVGANFDPRLTAVYSINENQNIRIGAGTATRNPTFIDTYMNANVKLTDLNGITGNHSPETYLGSQSEYMLLKVNGDKNLKPERQKNIDLGYNVKLGKKLELKLDVYYAQMNNLLKFGNTDGYIYPTAINNVYNLTGDVSALGIPNSMTQAQMETAIQQVDAMIANPAYSSMLTQLQTLKAGLTQISGMYGVPLSTSATVVNDSKTVNSYGGEISLFFMPIKNVTISANYAYININNDEYLFAKNKANIGLKYKIGKVYTGVTFSYMSEIKTIKERYNLNANIGIDVNKKIDIFITGYNLIQDNYVQIPSSFTGPAGDPLHRKVMAGIRIQF